MLRRHSSKWHAQRDRRVSMRAARRHTYSLFTTTYYLKEKKAFCKAFFL